MELEKQKIGVIGLGPKTGVSVVRYLHSKGANVFVYDEQPKSKLSESLKEINSIPVHLELGTLAPESLWDCKTWIVSPGVPSYKPYLIDARRKGIDTISELDFCSPYLQAPIMAVTGSNGKSTTTALLGHILKGWKKKVFVGGNLGEPLVHALDQYYDFIVIEVSSFQMELTERLHPKVACVLNITPNHLDRHGNMTTYKSLKEKLVQNMTKEDKAVLNDDDENCRLVGARTQASNWMFSWKNRKHAPIHIEEDEVLFPDGRKISLQGYPLVGSHNLENAVAAISMAMAVDCPKEVIEKNLRTFQGLPYRLEHVGEHAGVIFVNDAKSTTPEASIQALASIPRPIVYIAGGRSKNASYKELAEAARKKAFKVLLFGECREAMRRDFIGTDVETFQTLDEAFGKALEVAKKGDHILFSPANSSFDQYPNFEKRGEHFSSLVRSLAAKP